MKINFFRIWLPCSLLVHLALLAALCRVSLEPPETPAMTLVRVDVAKSAPEPPPPPEKVAPTKPEPRTPATKPHVTKPQPVEPAKSPIPAEKPVQPTPAKTTPSVPKPAPVVKPAVKIQPGPSAPAPRPSVSRPAASRPAPGFAAEFHAAAPAFPSASPGQAPGEWADKPGRGDRVGFHGAAHTMSMPAFSERAGSMGGGTGAGGRAVAVAPGMPAATAGRGGNGIPGGLSAPVTMARGSGDGGGMPSMAPDVMRSAGGQWADRPGGGSGTAGRRFTRMPSAPGFSDHPSSYGGGASSVGSAVAARPGMPTAAPDRGNGGGMGGVYAAPGMAKSPGGSRALPAMHASAGATGSGEWADKPGSGGGAKFGMAGMRKPAPAGAGRPTGSTLAGAAGSTVGIRPGGGAGGGPGRETLALGNGFGALPTPFVPGMFNHDMAHIVSGSGNAPASATGEWADKPGAGGHGPGGAMITPGAPTHGAVAVSGPPPTYPSLAQKEHLHGTVVLLVPVSASGTVIADHIKFFARSVSDVLDNEAKRTARRWHFQPGMHNGVAVESTVKLVVKFEAGKPPAVEQVAE